MKYLGALRNRDSKKVLLAYSLILKYTKMKLPFILSVLFLSILTLSSIIEWKHSEVSETDNAYSLIANVSENEQNPITEWKCYQSEEQRDAEYTSRLQEMDKTSVLIIDNDSYERYYCEGYCIEFCYMIKYYGEIQTPI